MLSRIESVTCSYDDVGVFNYLPDKYEVYAPDTYFRTSIIIQEYLQRLFGSGVGAGAVDWVDCSSTLCVVIPHLEVLTNT